ncbi:MAG: ATP-binding protein [Nitrospirota bacterium]
MAEVIGKVLDKATTDVYQFVAKGFFKARFVEVNAEHISKGAKIIGEVSDKQAINPYFERPMDVKYVSDEDETVPARTIYVGTVRTLALIRNNEQVEVPFPPAPGSNVFEADQDDIRLALKLGQDGIDIGILKGYNLPFKILPNKLLKTHMSILGQTGSGKSYLSAKIAVELMKLRYYADVPSNIAVPVLFDSSGEYSGNYDVGDQSKIAQIISPKSIRSHYFPLLNEKYLPLLYKIYDIDDKQESELRFWLTSASEGKPSGTVADNSQQQLLKQTGKEELLNEFNQGKIQSTRQLANKLEEFIKKHNRSFPNEKLSIPYQAFSKMREFDLKIKKSDDLDIMEEATKGIIINLSEYNNYEERQIAMLLVLRQLFEIAKNRKTDLKLILFIDEAHNYVPSVYKSYCKEELLKIAREGRKYGITLCLISQRPRWVDPTALSQCGTIFIFRIQNSDDKKHIFDSASLPDTLRDISIARFRTAEMIITGDVVGTPINCIVSEIDNDFVSEMARREKEAIVEPFKARMK